MLKKKLNIEIRKNVVRAKTVIYRRGTKTDSSYRTLQLTEGVMDILKEENLVRRSMKGCLARNTSKNDYIVKRGNGELYVPNTFTSCIQRCMKKAVEHAKKDIFDTSLFLCVIIKKA